MPEIQDRHVMQKITGVYQVVQIVVMTETPDGEIHETVVNSVRQPIPVPYEQ
jgi:hypothetical protein